MGVLNPAFWIFVAVIAGIYAIMALGLYVQFSLAGPAQFRPRRLHGRRRLHHGDPGRPLRLCRCRSPRLAGVAAAVAFALLLGVPTLRLRADYLAIATVAGGEIVRYLAMNLPELTGGPLGSMAMLGPDASSPCTTGGWQALLDARRRRARARCSAARRERATPSWRSIVWLLARRAASALFWRLERSPWGRVLKGDPRGRGRGRWRSARTSSPSRCRRWCSGAILGGLAGLLLALQIGVFSPDDYQPTLTFYAYLILILGGMNRIWAIPVGAVLFSLLYSGTRFLNFFPLSLFDSGSRAFLRLFLVGLLLVLFMALRPQGLLGDRRAAAAGEVRRAARGRRRQQVLRRRRGGRRASSFGGRRGLDHRADRPERRRQDDRLQPHLRLPARPTRGAIRFAGRAHRPAGAATRSRAPGSCASSRRRAS